MKGGTEARFFKIKEKVGGKEIGGCVCVDHLIKKFIVKGSIRKWDSSLRGSLNYYRFHDIDILTGINTFN